MNQNNFFVVNNFIFTIGFKAKKKQNKKNGSLILDYLHKIPKQKV